jgi:hypothetical protein
MAGTVIEVRSLKRRGRGLAALRQAAAEGGEVAVTVKKPHQQPKGKHRNVALIALGVAFAALAVSVIATWIALGRVSQHADQLSLQQEEKSWCGIMQNLTTLQVPSHPDKQTLQLMHAIEQKYDSLHCPASTPSAPPHSR